MPAERGPSGTGNDTAIVCPRCDGQKYDRGSCGLCGNLGVLDPNGDRLAVADRVTEAAPAPVVLIRNKAELAVAFQAWVDQHGYVWFEADLDLAMALCSYLGLKDLKINGVAV